MRQNELAEAIDQISRGRHIDKKDLINAVEGALMSASKKYFGVAQKISVHFNEETGQILATVKKKVVEDQPTGKLEISLEEALKINAETKVGEEVEGAISLEELDLGRISAQTAKQVVLQKVREAEREHIFEEYRGREGDLVNGSVSRVEPHQIIVDLGEASAILPAKEQVYQEHFRSGDRLRAYVLSVKKSAKGAQVIVSRTHPLFIKKLFEMEVPEMTSGVVEVKAIAREAGSRTKIAVTTEDQHVDAVGACVGVKGSRVQSVIREIQGEKIDIVEWNPDQVVFLTHSLSPAKITQILIDREKEAAIILVPDDQLSLAIGRKGQNARLASKLTGCRIDIRRESDYKKQEAEQQAQEAPASPEPAGEAAEPAKSPKTIEGLDMGTKTALKLIAAGYRSAVDLSQATVEDLVKIDGIGEKTANQILSQAKLSVESAGAAGPAAEAVAPQPETDQASSDTEKENKEM